jgi:hypothetical protein
MAKTSMSITKFVQLAKLLKPENSVLIRADHGVGKSQITCQLADHFRKVDFDGKDFPFYDKRMSQMESGDILGLPYTDGVTTRFNPPTWYKDCCDQPCFLFLDEINRATQEVQQSCFQIILDRELNGYKLHPQTRIYAAINTGAAYVVNEMDPALLDRFWTIDLDPTIEEWLEWAKTDDNVCYLIRDFIRTNEKFLDPHKDTEPGNVSTSRRSWHRLSLALVHAGLDETPEDPIFYSMCLGFVGTEASIAFVDFAKNADKQISGEDILNKLVKKLGKHNTKYTGFPKTDENAEKTDKEGNLMWDDTVYNDKLVEQLGPDRFGQERLVGLCEKVVDAVKKTLEGNDKKNLSPKQGAALGKFISIIPAELRISLWGKLTESNTENIEFIKTVHKYTVGHVLSVFGIPLDSDGSIQPQIPDFLKNDNS